jgi:hypothetical protein
MSSTLSLQGNTSVHLEDALTGASASKFASKKPPESQVEILRTNDTRGLTQMTVALSFAFDSVTRSLNIVMTDQNSGEVVRKFAYRKLPTDVHRRDKLHGLLLDQFA